MHMKLVIDVTELAIVEAVRAEQLVHEKFVELQLLL
jgi:hypothetical protein